MVYPSPHRAVISVAPVVAVAAIGLSLMGIPTAAADPDPHIPNAAAHWCPGGQRPGNGGQKYCLGVPYASGAFYAQMGGYGPHGPFGPWRWGNGAICSVWGDDGSVQGGSLAVTVPDCGGGPLYINVG